MSNTPPPLLQEEPRSAGAQAKKPGFFARQVARARLLLKLDIPLFFRLNFLCHQVRRQKGKYIFPYRGTRLRLAKTARINVRGHVFLNKGKYPHSRQECELALGEGAVWDVNGEFWLNRRVSVGVGKNAHLTTGQAIHPNVGSSIGCGKKITIGNHVAIGHMVYIFDTDSHPRYDSEGKRANADKEVIIEDNVWIGAKSTILKGTRIGTGSVIAANSLVSGYVPPHTMVASTPAHPSSRT